MTNLNSVTTKRKTSARITEKYCCLDFRDAQEVSELLHYSEVTGRYSITSPHDNLRIAINYCPWCTKPVPWKEKP